MTLVDGFAPPPSLQAMLVVRKTTKKGVRGGTVEFSHGWSQFL